MFNKDCLGSLGVAVDRCGLLSITSWVIGVCCRMFKVVVDRFQLVVDCFG